MVASSETRQAQDPSSQQVFQWRTAPSKEYQQMSQRIDLRENP